MYKSQDTNAYMNYNFPRLLSQEVVNSGFRPLCWGYLCWLIVGTGISCVLYTQNMSSDWQYATRMAVFFSGFTVVLHLFRLSFVRPLNYFAPDLFYILFYSLFHLGYLLFWFFKVVPDDDFVFPRPQQYPLVLLIVNLGLYGFLIGYELTAPRSRRPMTGCIRKMPTKTWESVGILFMVFALVIHFYYILRVGPETFVLYGYEVFMKMDEYLGGKAYFWGHHTKLFALGLAVYMVAVSFRHKSIRKAKTGLVMMIIFCSLLALEGARTPLMQIGMVFFLVCHFLIKPIKFKSLIVIVVVALTLFGAIRIGREAGGLNIGKMAEAIKYSRQSQESRWYDSLLEIGSTVRTVNLTTMLVPESSSYWLGRSYFQSIVHVVPFLQGVFISRLGVTPSQWLTWTHFGYDAAGTGFSMAAEGYLNFGLPGVFIHMFVLGAVFRRIYVRFADSPTPAKALVLFLSYGFFLITVRNTTNTLLPGLVQVCIFVWLLRPFSLNFGPEDSFYDETTQAAITAEEVQ